MNLIRVLIYVLFLKTGLFSCSVQSEELPKIDIIWATESWKNFTNIDGTGFYHELMNKIFNQSPYKVTVEYYPWKRALHQVEIRQANISGALPNNGQYLFADVPILTQAISILMPSKNSNLTLDEIKALVGVWPEMYTKQLIQSQISPYINGLTAQYRHDAIKLLQNSKVDYYLDIKNMLEEQLATLPKAEQSNYQIQELSTLNLYLIFSNDPKGIALKSYYEAATKRLFASGQLQSLYKKYQLSININENNPHLN